MVRICIVGTVYYLHSYVGFGNRLIEDQKLIGAGETVNNIMYGSVSRKFTIITLGVTMKDYLQSMIERTYWYQRKLIQ